MPTHLVRHAPRKMTQAYTMALRFFDGYLLGKVRFLGNRISQVLTSGEILKEQERVFKTTQRVRITDPLGRSGTGVYEPL